MFSNLCHLDVLTIVTPQGEFQYGSPIPERQQLQAVFIHQAEYLGAGYPLIN
jgi:hypothetical protein